MKTISMLDEGFNNGVILLPEILIGMKSCLEVNAMRTEESEKCINISESNLQLLHEAYGVSAFSKNILPAIYLIEPTNACNLSCKICPNSNISNKYFMDFNQFRRIINEIKYEAKAIRLNYLGEPLLHPKIVEMIKYCKENTSAKISLSTNGILLDKILSERIIETEIDEIIFSLDANTRETYHKIKGLDSFDKVVTNIEHFLMINTNNTKVLIKFVKMHLNKHELDGFKKRWNKYNCDIKESWLNTWANQLPGLKDLSDTLCPNIGKHRMACADLWYKMVITAQGTVPLCCYDYMGKNITGDSKINHIKDIWNCQKLHRYRKAHLESKYNQLELCKNCLEWSGKNDVLQYLDVNIWPVGKP